MVTRVNPIAKSPRALSPWHPSKSPSAGARTRDEEGRCEGHPSDGDACSVARCVSRAKAERDGREPNGQHGDEEHGAGAGRDSAEVTAPARAG